MTNKILTFLRLLKERKTPCTVFLVNGVKLQGTIHWHSAPEHGQPDILLRRETQLQAIYSHAISTVMPNDPLFSEDLLKADESKV